MTPPLSPGDPVTYSLSFDGGGFWLKFAATSNLREGESPAQAYDRLGGVVDNLLQFHAKRIQDGLRPS